MRSKFAISIFASLVALLAQPVDAQEFNWTNATGDGDWNNELNWNLGGDGVPLGGSDVNINGGVGAVFLNATGILNLTTLDLAPGAVFNFQLGDIGFGPAPVPMQNSGELNVFSTASMQLRNEVHNFSPATINLIDGGILDVHSDNAVLNTSNLNTGNGTINMSNFTGGSSDSIITGTSGAILTIQKQSISGFGEIGDNQIGFSLDSDTIIDANLAGREMTIDPHNTLGIVNQGIMRASGGGLLHFEDNTVINNSGSLIEAGIGSEVTFDTGYNISGGTLRKVGTGVFDLSGSGSLENIFLDGPTVTVPQQGILFLAGTIQNGGEIVIVESSGGGATQLVIAEAATLVGAGTITLQAIADFFTARITDNSGANGILTNVDNTIQGRGRVGNGTLQIINQAGGVIDANDGAGQLMIDSTGTAINRGLYTASAGGTLVLSSGEFDNADGLIEPQNDSTIRLNNMSNVIGGTLRNVGTGQFVFDRGTVTDATFEGTFTIGQQLGLSLSGTIENEGEIVISETSGGGVSELEIAESASLTGGGVVTLSSVNDTFTARITDYSGADGVLTNVDNTIQGRGRVGHDRVRIINESPGVIVGNNPAGLLTVGVSPATPSINRGLITAADGGNLVFVSGDWNNSDGLIEPQSLSTVTVDGTAVIQGGILNAANDSTIVLTGSSSVVDVVLQSDGSGNYEVPSGNPSIVNSTNESVITINTSANLTLVGTIANHGEIVITETSGGSATDLQIDESVSLTGGGVVTLQAIHDFFTARITDDSGSDGILTNVDNTIQGRGRVGNDRVQVINQVDGTIHANVAGTLTVDMPASNPTFANEGTLKASNGGTLNFVNALENGVQGIMSGDSIIASGETILNMGTIAPGNSAGTLTMNADLTMETSSSLEIEIENLNMLDLLDVNGTVELGGELNLSFLNGYEPLPTDTFDLLIADSLTGSFTNAANGAVVETGDGSGKFTVNYVGGTVRLSNFASYTMPETLTVSRGTLVNGEVGVLELADNEDLVIRRNNTDIQSRTEFELAGTSPLAAPSTMSVILEGAVFARSRVNQTISLYNFVTESFEQVDVRDASRLIDSRTTVSISGDLTRFVDQTTLAIRARVQFRSPSPRQQFSSNTDQFAWVIE